MLFNINGVILLKYKIIAFDLDGTLLNDVKEIPEENLRMLHRAAECGVLALPLQLLHLGIAVNALLNHVVHRLPLWRRVR